MMILSGTYTRVSIHFTFYSPPNTGQFQKHACQNSRIFLLTQHGFKNNAVFLSDSLDMETNAPEDSVRKISTPN